MTLQDVALAEMRMPVFRQEPLALVRELYEQEQEVMEHTLPAYKVGDNVIVDLPTRTIEGKIGYVGETDVRIDTSAQGQSWDNEVINKQQFEDGLRQVEPELSDEELDALPISTVMDGKVQTFPDAAALDEALIPNLRQSLPETSASRTTIWARAAQSRNTPGTLKPSEPCSSWKRSTGVPPPRSSRCFPSMWAGAVWQMLLTPKGKLGCRVHPAERTAL